MKFCAGCWLTNLTFWAVGVLVLLKRKVKSFPDSLSLLVYFDIIDVLLVIFLPSMLHKMYIFVGAGRERRRCCTRT